MIAMLVRRRKRVHVNDGCLGSGTEETAEAGRQNAGIPEICRSLREQYRAILEAVPDTVLLLTPDQKIFWTNDAAWTSLGKDSPELEGRFCHEVWHHRIGNGICCPGRKCVTTGIPEASQGWTRDQRLFDIRAVPLRDACGDIVCVVEMGRETTDLHRLETQLRQSQKMEMIGQLAGGIAHDFNNHLTAIMGFGYLLQVKLPEHGPERVHLSQIISAAERAAALTESLISFSRKNAPVMAHADLNLIVRGMADMLARLLGEDIELCLTLSDTTLPVQADRVLLGQVLLSLSSNARDAMPGGGTLEIRTFPERVGMRPCTDGRGSVADGFVLLEVKAPGMGMDTGTVTRVFEQYFTAKESENHAGLGLTMAQDIVSQHGGCIDIFSEPGKGTTFRVFLPRDETGIVEPIGPVSSPLVGRNTTVLLVEDDDHTREFVRELLSGYGCFIIEARDGREGLERFLEQPDEVSLLICDLVGPEKNGRQIYDELLKYRPELKALFITEYPLETLLERGIDTGNVPLLPKPFDPREFILRVMNLLD